MILFLIKDILDLEQTFDSTQVQITECNISQDSLELKHATLLDDLKTNREKKIMSTNTLLIFQKIQKRYRELEGKTYTLLPMEKGKRDAEYSLGRSRLDRIQGLVTDLIAEVGKGSPFVIHLEFIESTLNQLDHLLQY